MIMDEQLIASLCGGDVKSAAAVLERFIHLVSQTNTFNLYGFPSSDFFLYLMICLFYFRILIDLVFRN